MNESKLKHINASKTVRDVIRAMPVGTLFHGWELKNECVKLCPELKNMYVDSFLRKMRNLKSQYILINRNESLYMKVDADDSNHN